MTFLLDSSALIPLCFAEHMHHRSVTEWTDDHPDFSVCPITQGALVRYIFRSYGPSGAMIAEQTLSVLAGYGGYEFWSDDLPFERMNLRHLIGHQQVTDAYLVSLAASRGGRLATFDSGLASIYPEALLIPIL